jgi:putative endonuclease
MDNKEVGYKNESLAVDFLIKKGFIILNRNYRFSHFEIDIIAKKNDQIHFIEVKFRRNNSYGYPESFVSKLQQERIKKASENYLYENNIELNIVFDIISIEENNKITLFEDAF